MSGKTYILCPGQGAQVVGMGKDFFESSAAAREVFTLAEKILGWNLVSLAFGGPEEKLNQTDISQPAIYVTSVACFRAAREAGLIDPEQVTAYAGLSLGEYTALHLGGAFGFEEGLRLVALRGQAMQAAAAATPSGMVSLASDETTVNKLCGQCAQGEVLVPANFNAPGSIVVSGAIGACQRVIQAAEAAGIRAVPLKVAGAFHSPLMLAAADKMRAELERVQISTPKTTVYANVSAHPHGDADSIRQLLVEQITRPVRWEQTMSKLLAEGEARWVELAPGRVLTGLLKKLNRRAPIESLASAGALTGVKA